MSETTYWQGKSGQSYTYTVHPLSWRPGANQDGNYIFAKVVNGVWKAVYIGQGDLQERYDAALREGCVQMKSATHYHERLNNSVTAREQEENDLISGNPECEWPVGCNGHD